MKKYKMNVWYKVYYTCKSEYSDDVFRTFVYRMNTEASNDSIERTIREINNDDSYELDCVKEWLVR